MDGNQLVVRLPEGTRELIVPDDFRFIVDGQPLSVGELKVGMKGTATITTRTTVTPVTVTEVKNGTVMQSTGSSIITDRRGNPVIHAGRNRQARRQDHARRQARANLRLPRGRSADGNDHHIEAAAVVTEKDVQATLAAAKAAAKPPATTAGRRRHGRSRSRSHSHKPQRLPRRRCPRPLARGPSSGSRLSSRLR